MVKSENCYGPMNAREGFGEAYLVTINGGIVKDWRLHKRMTATLFLLSGIVRLVLFDPGRLSTHENFKRHCYLDQINYV